MTLFGLNLAPLYFAIAMVESDCGATDRNVYQLTGVYVNDVNRIMREAGRRYFPPFILSDVSQRRKAEDMMRVYWFYWGQHYERKAYKPVSYEVLARIHFAGPLGWKKPQAVKYWQRVKSCMNYFGYDVGEKWMSNRHPNFWKLCSSRYHALTHTGPRPSDYVSLPSTKPANALAALVANSPYPIYR